LSGVFKNFPAAHPRESDYCFLLRIQRPTTLVTEDGRIYHDVDLFNSEVDFNRDRLIDLLFQLVRKYSGKNFLEIYYKIQDASKTS
jgi:hypothetical protein